MNLAGFIFNNTKQELNMILKVVLAAQILDFFVSFIVLEYQKWYVQLYLHFFLFGFFLDFIYTVGTVRYKFVTKSVRSV